MSDSGFFGAFSKSGGLGYHLRALLSRRLWTSHLRATERFLAGWRPAAPNLVLVGPSAGYSLPAGFLSRFGEVVGLEPDPVARKLISRRFRDIDLRWRDDDILSPRDGRMGPDGLAELHRELPEHAVLFCNVLGQMTVLFDEATEGGLQPLLDGIPEVLGEVGWASYHDRVAGPWPPALDRVELERAIDTDELVDRVYVGSAGSIIEYGDHGTGMLAPELPRTLWTWQRSPTEFHVIEGVCWSP